MRNRGCWLTKMTSMSPFVIADLNDDDGPIENFTSLSDAIKSGGQRAERARRIQAQFANLSAQKAGHAHVSDSTDMDDSGAGKKKPRSFSSFRRGVFRR